MPYDIYYSMIFNHLFYGILDFTSSALAISAHAQYLSYNTYLINGTVYSLYPMAITVNIKILAVA